MKKILLLIAAFTAVSSLSAQTQNFQKFYDTYSGLEGYTTIEMSGKMLSMINVDGDSVDKELGEVFRKVKRLLIVVVDKNNDEFTAAINKLVSGDDYEMLTSVNDEGVKIKFYVADNNREFLMYVSDKDNSLLLSINGEKMTMNQVTQFTKIITVK